MYMTALSTLPATLLRNSHHSPSTRMINEANTATRPLAPQRSLQFAKMRQSAGIITTKFVVAVLNAIRLVMTIVRAAVH